MKLLEKIKKKLRTKNSESLTPSTPTVETRIHGSSIAEPLGDGKGVFLSDMDEEERDDYIKSVDHGWGKFYQKIRNIGK